MKNKVVILLSLTLLIMCVVPLWAAMVFLGNAFESQEQIYKNQKLDRILIESQASLKKLSALEPEKEDQYKNLFNEIQDIKLIYGEDRFFSDRLQATISKYFFVGFGAATLISLVVGLFLSRLVNQIYKKSYDELQEAKDRGKYLEEIARWQEMAKKMAHEIRRPLQPIRTWVANLVSVYSSTNTEKPNPLLDEAKSAIEQEIKQLGRLVDEFAKFADLPKPQVRAVNVTDFLAEFVNQHNGIWEGVSFKVDEEHRQIQCTMDPLLMRQILSNMVENAVEANPNKETRVEFRSQTLGNQLILDVFNTGRVLGDVERKQIFDLYFSTKGTAKNMGLGLSIVKAAILEQGGSIDCIEETLGARFRIKLPLAMGEQSAS